MLHAWTSQKRKCYFASQIAYSATLEATGLHTFGWVRMLPSSTAHSRTTPSFQTLTSMALALSLLMQVLPPPFIFCLFCASCNCPRKLVNCKPLVRRSTYNLSYFATLAPPHPAPPPHTLTTMHTLGLCTKPELRRSGPY